MEEFKKQLPNEEIINDGQGIFIRKKTLFHGSPLPNIDKLNPAEETTIGEGVYFTSKLEDAEGYAIRRSSSRKGEPVVYQAKIENLKFIDLRSDSNVRSTLNGFLEVIENQNKVDEIDWFVKRGFNKAIEKIQTNKINAGNLREITFGLGKLFTEYIISLGYDGLIAIEGGEGNDIGNHDTYLIFDPEKISDLEVLPPSH